MELKKLMELVDYNEEVFFEKSLSSIKRYYKKTISGKFTMSYHDLNILKRIVVMVWHITRSIWYSIICIGDRNNHTSYKYRAVHHWMIVDINERMDTIKKEHYIVICPSCGFPTEGFRPYCCNCNYYNEEESRKFREYVLSGDPHEETDSVEEAIKNTSAALEQLGQVITDLPLIRKSNKVCPSCGANKTNNYLCDYCGTEFKR
jgi:ribosomal protein S27AE